VVLGSATPSAESYANGRRRRYRVLQLTRRVQQREFARVEIIDLRRHSAELAKPRTPATLAATSKPPGPGNFSAKVEPAEATAGAAGLTGLADQVPLSAPLIEALAQNLAAAGQTLVFLNRRGYHNFLQCRSCGSVITCSS
jgi:primosomal protein N' (replication factor Y)